MNNLYILITSLIYSILLICVYFYKKRVVSLENKIYISLMITNFIGLLLDVSSIISVSNMDIIPVLNVIITKTYLLYLFVWASLFTAYVYVITKKNKKLDIVIEKLKLLIFFAFILIVVIIYKLPLYYHYDNFGIYSYGPSTDLLYFIISIYFVIWIARMIINYKNLKSKKYLPIFFFLLLGFIVMIIQKLYPTMLLMTSMETFITFLMYFTIENPDIRMVKQLKNTYVMNDKINKDREYFSFKVAQEMRRATSLMSKINDDILENKTNPEVIEENIGYSKEVNRDLQVITNNILDISAIDSSKLKITNNKYNVQYLFDEINLYCKNTIPENIEFRSSFSENIPSRLHGDDIRLKQIIYTILDNSIKHTKKGFIELDVQCIIKYDICRLIITMEDSGVGMDLKQVNELLESEKDLSDENFDMLDSKNMNLKLVKKLIHFIGGVINISSTPDIGTKTRIIIDQKIPEDSISKDDKYIEKYKVMLRDKKRIVIIAEEDSIKNQLQKFMTNNEYDLRFLDVTKNCLDMVRNGEEIDLILMQEDMSKIDAYELLQKLKAEKNFNGNIIIIAKNLTTEKRSDLLHSGFKEVINLPIDRSSLNDKLKLLLTQKKKS